MLIQVYRLPPLPPTPPELDDWMIGCSQGWLRRLFGLRQPAAACASLR